VKPIAWVLAVVSSEQQSETLQFQRAWAQEVAKAQGWRIDRLGDFDGVGSGKDGPRLIVKRMIAELEKLPQARRPKFLLMIRLDRLGRGEQIHETQAAVSEIIRLGVTIWMREPAGELRANTLVEQFGIAFSAMQSASENLIRRDKILNVYKRKREAGKVIGNRRPYGLKLSKDGYDIPCEPAAQTVREIFKLRLEGLGHGAIGKAIAPTAAPQVFKNSEMQVRWTTQRVSRILANRSYVPTVIDEVTFFRAGKVNEQLGIQSIRSQRKWPFKLATALTCSCGRKMNGICTGPARKRVLYYICKAEWNHNGKARMVRATPLEDHFEEILELLGVSPEALEKFCGSDNVAPLDQLKKSLRTAKKQVSDVMKKRGKVVDLHLSGHIKAEDIQNHLDQYDTELDELSARIVQIEEQSALQMASESRKKDRTPIPDIALMFRNGTIDDQRRIARLFATDYGLFVTPENTLKLGFRHDPKRQRKPQARELLGDS
jgi:hypothetical protein